MQKNFQEIINSAPQVFNDFSGAPDLIKKGNLITHGPIDRDVLTLSLLTAASACMSKTCGIYSGKKLFANTFTYFVGLSASGKGRMSDILFAVENIDHMYEASVNAPFLLPANTTEMSFARAIYQAQRSQLLCDTESDTIACTFNNQSSRFSSMARKIAQHENIDFSRCCSNGSVVRYKIVHPCLSMALSGTPDQLQALFNRPGNGLFSRFSFYILNPDKDWHDPFLCRAGEISDEDFMRNLGKELFNISVEHLLLDHEVEVFLPDDLQKEFSAVYKPLHENMWECDEATLVGCVDRQGIQAFRLMMVAETLKHYEAGSAWPERLEVSRETFDFVMNAMKQLFVHTELVYDLITSSPVPTTAATDELAKVAGSKFTIAEFMAATGKVRRTAFRLLNKLVDEGLIVKLSRGVYEKVVTPTSSTSA